MLMWHRLAAVAVVLSLLACSGEIQVREGQSPHTDAQNPTAAPAPDPSTSQAAVELLLPCEILGIVQTRCASCHGAVPSSGAPTPLVDYADLTSFAASDAGVQVARVALSRLRSAGSPMPPYPEPPLSPQEITAWQSWVDGGMQPRWRGAPRECGPAVAMPTACDAPATVFALRCANAGCHTRDDSAGGLDLTAPFLRDLLTDKPSSSDQCEGQLWMDAEHPENSLLLRKLGDEPPCGDPMPPLGHLSDSEARCIEDWVRAAVAAP
jgi:mono/diheme cytochrome c family protein